MLNKNLSICLNCQALARKYFRHIDGPFKIVGPMKSANIASQKQDSNLNCCRQALVCA